MKTQIAETLMSKKTKLSGIVDNTSMGISLGQAELQISPKVARELRKQMRKHPLFSSGGKDSLEGNIEYIMQIEEGLSIMYEFKKQGNNVFLNVGGNPTKLMTGKNSVPVLLKKGEYAGNAVVNTFKYANRVMFAILEYIPEFDFEWEGIERRKILEGEFNVSRLQYAWYTRDLLDKRDDVFHHLRLCYGGANAVNGKSRNLVKDLGLKFQAFDNTDGNFVISGTVGDKKEFSLTLYAKDEEGKKNEDEKDRFQRLIRFDCSFNDYFLKGRNIKLVKDLERVYEDKCEEGGYDLGFVKWLAQALYDRLNMNFIVTMTHEKYDTILQRAETFMEEQEWIQNNPGKKLKKKDSNGKEVKVPQRNNAYLLIKDWLNFNNFDTSIKERCDRLKIPQAGYARDYEEVKELTGIDLNISHSFITGMLDNRHLAMRTEEERQGYVLERKSNQKSADIDKNLRDKDLDRATNVSSLLFNEEGLRLRRLKPVVLKASDFYAYKILKEKKF